MKIAIIGSAGFIGAHLTGALAKERKIVPVSRASHGDFYRIKNWTEILKDCDAVIHLAAQIHTKDEMPDLALTQDILGGAIVAGVQDFIFLSSAAIYGAAPTPVSEDAAAQPSGAYGRGKAKAEDIIMAAQGKIRPAIIRAPLVYGPDCHANFLMLAKAVQRGVPLPLASVKNARSYLYVGNLSSFIERVLSAPQIKGVYNLADETLLSTPALIRMMGDVMNVRARLFPFPPALLQLLGVAGLRRQIDGLTGSFILDCSRAKKAGWQAPFSTCEGLSHTLSQKD